MSELNWAQIITAIVAVYGAIVSTKTFISNKREKFRKLAIEISYGLLAFDNGKTSDNKLFITTANTGYKKATVNIPRIVLPNRKALIFPYYESDISFPYQLEEGTDCSIWIDIKEFCQSLQKQGYNNKVKLVAEAKDHSGKWHRSKSFKFDVQSWL